MQIRNHKTSTSSKFIHSIRELSFSKRISWIEKMLYANKICVYDSNSYIRTFFNDSTDTLEEEVIKNYISFLTLLFDTLDKIYPGKWDVHVTEKEYPYYYNRDTELSGKYYLLTPFIHYKKVNLVSENTSEHLIRDLFLGIQTGIDTFSDKGIINDLLGFRSTLSFAEWLSGYNHSHLSKTDRKDRAGNILRFSNFCIGSGDISELIPRMNDEDELGFSEENWGMFFSVVETMIAWESISGNPYHEISKISENRSSLIVNNILRHHTRNRLLEKTYHLLYTDLFKSLDKFTFTYNSGKYYVNFNQNHINQLKQFIVDNIDDSYEIIVKKENNSLIGYQKNDDNNPLSMIEASSTINDEIPYFFLSGRKIYFKILPPELEYDNNISNFHIREEFLNKLKDEFNKTAYQQQVILTARKNACAEFQS